jgi:hypothetical protein
MKHCQKCDRDLPESDYYIRSNKRGLRSVCRSCWNAYRKPQNNKQWWYDHHNGKPMNENKSCASYLGVYIAENALKNMFDHMEHAPNNTPGYDFLCGKGFKIDAKSSVLFQHGNGRWSFSINRNAIADYFLCVGFDNRKLLNPLHIWLIPGRIVNKKKNVTISMTNIKKWDAYEMSPDKMVLVKEAIKGVA